MGNYFNLLVILLNMSLPKCINKKKKKTETEIAKKEIYLNVDSMFSVIFFSFNLFLLLAKNRYYTRSKEINCISLFDQIGFLRCVIP